MIPRDWFDYTSLAIGAWGLAYAWWVGRRAEGARAAADAARRVLYLQHAKEDMERLVRLASDFAVALDRDQYDLALYVGREFVSFCAGMIEHHREWLGRESGTLNLSLRIGRDLLAMVQNGPDHQVSVGDAQRLLVTLSGLTGVLKRISDTESK